MNAISILLGWLDHGHAPRQGRSRTKNVKENKSTRCCLFSQKPEESRWEEWNNSEKNLEPWHFGNPWYI